MKLLRELAPHVAYAVVDDCIRRSTEEREALDTKIEDLRSFQEAIARLMVFENFEEEEGARGEQIH